MPVSHPYRLGRKARMFDPRVPHMSAVLGAVDLPAPPTQVDWTKGIVDFGMMLNDTLGCCTCAAVFHARQIWTANTGTEITEPDSDVLELYEQACGYKPGDPSTDQGGVEQNVLTYLLNIGMPIGGQAKDKVEAFFDADPADPVAVKKAINDLPPSREKIIAFFEVDPRNTEDVMRTINECGLAYIGFEVPSSIFANGEPPAVWTVEPNSTIEGGHAVVLVGYDKDGPTVISWGKKYKMTWDFFRHYTDECYAIIDHAWVTSTGKTPLNLSVEELEKFMEAIKR